MRIICLWICVLSLAPVTALAQPEAVSPRVATTHEVRLLPPIHFAAAELPEFPDEMPPGNVEDAPNSAMTLAELEQMALADNPTLAQAQARIQAARGNFVQVGLKPNPVVGYAANEIGNNGAAGQQGAFVGQRFITAGKLGLSRQVAAQGDSAPNSSGQRNNTRVLNDVRRAYYRALIAQRRVETTEQLRDLSGEMVHRAEALLQGREGSQVNLLQAKSEAQTVQLNQATAKNQLQIARRQLAAVVGAPDLEQRPLAGDAMEPSPPITWEDALNTLRTQSPEMAVALTNVERARWEVNREFAGRVPDVDGWVAVQHDYATGDNVTLVQVGLPLPLFNRNQGNIAKARAELRDAERALERVELDLMNRLAEAYGRYTTAQQQAELYTREILPNAKQALELVRVGYREGETDYLTVLTAQRTYFQSSLAYLDAARSERGDRRDRGIAPYGQPGNAVDPKNRAW